MAYLRKPDGHKRGKGNSTPTSSKPAQPLMPSFSVVLEPPGEDRASHERHLKCLKRECRLLHPNKQVHVLRIGPSPPVAPYFPLPTHTDKHTQIIFGKTHPITPFTIKVTQDLMKRTYAFRRRDILDGTITTEDLFSSYPPLKYCEEV